MGFWDSILGEEKEEEKAPVVDKRSTNPFAISLRFAPLRLTANKKNSVDLVIKVTNISDESHLLSVDALLPRNALLGFDEACINKAVEKRVGELEAGASTEVPITVWANNQTQEGNYPVDVTVYSHYMGFDKVLSYLKKGTSLRVV